MKWINVKDGLPPYTKRVFAEVLKSNEKDGTTEVEMVVRSHTDCYGEHWKVISTDPIISEYKQIKVEWWAEIPKRTKK